MKSMILVAGMALLLGCIPYSEKPLSMPGQEGLDKRLYGSWWWKEGNEIGFLLFGLDDKSTLMRIMMVGIGKDDELDYSVFSAHRTRIGENDYLNVKQIDPKDESSGYMFVKYRVTEDSLGISIIGSKTMEKAVETGRLKGTIEQGKWATSITLQDEPATLRSFVKKHDKDLFQDMQYLPRLEFSKEGRATPRPQAPPRGDTQIHRES